MFPVEHMTRQREPVRRIEPCSPCDKPSAFKRVSSIRSTTVWLEVGASQKDKRGNGEKLITKHELVSK